jgi:hypothetical protein
MSETTLPAGWDEDRVRRVLDHYETQTDEEATAEDEDVLNSATHAVMEVPHELLPAVRELISKRKAV